MLKKWIAFLLTTVLVMALCPAMAMAETENNWDMEGNWVNVVDKEGNDTGSDAPEGYTVTLGEGATVSCDSNTIQGNSTKKIKISHLSADGATEETTTTVTFKLQQEENNKKSATYYLSFWLESLAVSENEGVDTGLQFSVVDVKNWQPRKTDFFKDTNYTHWRKACVYSLGNVYAEPEFTVTFKGVGVVYLDDFEKEYSDIIVNGGFEGVSGDGKITGVKYTSSQTGLWAPGSASASYTDFYTVRSVKSYETIEEVIARYFTVEDETNGGTKISVSWPGFFMFVESAENNYMVTVNQSSYNIAYTGSDETKNDLNSGGSYRITFDNKSDNVKNGCVLKLGLGADFPYTGKFAGTSDWTTKCVDFVYGFGSVSNSYLNRALKIHINGGETKISTEPYTLCYFDDFKLEPIEEKTVLKNAEGKEVTALEPGEMSLTFEKALFDTTTDEPYDANEDNGEGGTVIVKKAAAEGYETKTKISVSAAFYRKVNDTLQLESVEILDNIRGITETDYKKTISTESGETTFDLTEVGFLPAQASFAFNIPAEGDYEVRLMIWDGIGSMSPASAQVYTYTTASEA